MKHLRPFSCLLPLLALTLPPSTGRADVACVTPRTLAGFVSAPHSPGNVGLTEDDPVQAADGTIYFTLNQGGAHYNGAIVKVKDGVMSTVYDFEGTTAPPIGRNPAGGLVIGTDGNLYGHTSGGGASNKGTLFRCTPAGVLTTLHSFSGTSSTPSPVGALLQASDGNFYGMTNAGGATYGAGTVFRLTSAGVFTELVAFTGANAVDSPTEGVRPRGSLTERTEGSVKYLYGVLEQSGTGGYGRIFKFPLPAANAVTVSPQTVVRFTGTVGAAKGSQPKSGLRLANDGALYGTANQGGTQGYGTLYRISAAGVFSTVYEFPADPAIAGGSPFGAPVQGSDGFLYGTTTRNGGGVYRISTSGTGAALISNYATSGPMGQAPIGLLMAAGGQIYGLSEQGGPRNRGVLFRVLGSGTARSTYTVLDFGLRSSTLEGAFPTGGLVESNGLYYGTTEEGGSELNSGRGYGTLYSMTPAGKVTTLVSFTNTGAIGGIPGIWPKAALTRLGDGTLYGTTSSGGSMGKGTVFRYQPATRTFSSVAYFSGTTATGGGAKGESPYGELVDGNDGYLYGTTRYGGTANMGTVFRISKLDNTVQTLTEFTGTSGAARGNQPIAGLLPQFPAAGQPATAFYGSTIYGGTSDVGTVFRMTPAGAITTLVQFTGSAGANPGAEPYGRLIWKDGFLYGTTRTSSGVGFGTLFMVNPTSGAHTQRLTFGNGFSPGRNPLAGVIEAADGYLYGTNSAGASDGPDGRLFRFNPATGGAETVGVFQGLSAGAALSGSTPMSSLSYGLDGLYGTTYQGGPGNGTIFRINFGTGIAVLPPLKVSDSFVRMRGTVEPYGNNVTIGFETVPEDEINFPPYAYYSNTTTNTPREYTYDANGFQSGVTYLIRAVASGPCGNFYSGWYSYRHGSVYDSWKGVHFGDNAGTPSVAGDTIDTDRDGVPNLVEFLTDTDPLAFSVPPLTASIDTTTGQRLLKFSYRSRTNADGGESLILQFSTNLQSWQTLAAAGGTEAIVPGSSLNFSWLIEGSVPIPGTRGWVRLKATR